MPGEHLNKMQPSAKCNLHNGVLAILLLLAFFGLGAESYASQQLAPTTTQLRHVIEAHFRAIEDNQLNQAMTYYHSLSPIKAQARNGIELGLSQFLLKNTILKFCFHGLKDQFAVVSAEHKFLRISGIKFTVEFVNVAYQLREEQGNWKIWSQQENPNDSATYSSCDLVGNTKWVSY